MYKRSEIFWQGNLQPSYLLNASPWIHYLPFSNQDYEKADSMEQGKGLLSYVHFHNMNCDRGFVYVGDEIINRVGVLLGEGHVNYHAQEPFCKIALCCTPHKVAYHDGLATYGALESMHTLTTREEKLARILQLLEHHNKGTTSTGHHRQRQKHLSCLCFGRV